MEVEIDEPREFYWRGMGYGMYLRKIGLGKKTRFFLLAIVGLLMVLSVYNIYRVFGEPLMIKKNVPIYSFQHQGKMDYRVQLKPNTILSETYLDSDEVYYSKLVESIDTDFSYRYTADQPAKLKVIYGVVAVVEAPEMWRKEFPLVPETVLEEEGKTISFSRPFSFNLEPYQEYLRKANEQLGVSSREPRVVVRADINVVAESTAGKSSEKLTPSMEIPLASGKFKIGGTLSPKVLLLGVITGFIVQIGDLVESAIKRMGKIKDSGTLIPGHGGVLDRFDSLLFSAPVAYFFIKLILF